MGPEDEVGLLRREPAGVRQEVGLQGHPDRHYGCDDRDACHGDFPPLNAAPAEPSGGAGSAAQTPPIAPFRSAL
jgi:hypothetical protein